MTDPPGPPAARRRRWPARLARGLLATVLAVVAIIALAFAALQTPPARRAIERLLASTLGTADRPAEVSGLAGLLPFDFRLAKLALPDDGGHWLTLTDVRLRVEAWPLLAGRLVIADLGAARVALERLPPADPLAPAEPFTWPQLPKLPEVLPLAVELRRLEVASLALGPAVLGQPAEFRLGGAGKADGQAVDLRLDLQRTDADTGAASLRAEADLGRRTLKLDLVARETGGLVAAALKNPAVGNLDLRLAGVGPLADWRARLDLALPGLVTAGADLRLGLDGPLTLALDATAQPVPSALPDGAAALLGERVSLTARVAPGPIDRLDLTELRLAAAAGTLTGEGSLTPADGSVAAVLAVAAPDLSAFSALAGTPLAGDGSLRLDLRGTTARPEADLALDLTQPRAAGVAAERLTVRLLPRLAADLGTGRPPLTFSATADLTGLTLADGSAPAGQDRLGLDLAGALPSDGPATLDRLALVAPAGRLEGSGRYDLAGQDGRADLALTLPDLGTLLPPLGLADGRGRLAATAGIDLAASGLSATLQADATDLAGLPPAVAELLGAAPKLAVTVRRDAAGALLVERLDLEGAAAKLAGQGSMAADGALAGRTTLALPDLAALDRVTGQALKGSAELALDVAGTLESPTLALQLRAPDLRVSGRPLGRVGLDVKGGGPVATAVGNARLTVDGPGGELALALKAVRQAEGVRLTDLALSGPGTKLAGELTLSPAGLPVTGRLQGKVADLAALRPWHGQDLAGPLALDVTATAPGGRQAAELRLTGGPLRSTAANLASLDLRAKATELLGQPALDARLGLTGVTAGGQSFDTAALTAKGTLGRLALTLQTAGRVAGKPMDLDAVASLALDGPTTRLQLSRLQGQVLGKPLRLARPSDIVLDGAGQRVAGLDLAVLGGRLTADGGMGPKGADLSAKVDNLPLGSLTALGAPPLDGSADATLRLTGALKAPQLAVEVTGQGIRPAGEQRRGLPPLGLKLSARTAGGALQAEASLTGLTDAPVTATARLPFALSLAPFRAELPPDGPLTAALRGRLDLARLGRAMALDGQTLAGSLALDLAAGGTLANPALSGSAVLNDGRVADADTGLLLRDLGFRLVGEGSVLRLTDLSARDRRNGRLTGQGRLRLDGLAIAELEAALDLTRLELLRGDLGTAAASGRLTAGRDPSGLKLAGQLTVDRADIAVPEGGASGPPKLAVRVKGAPPVAKPSAPVTPPLPIALAIRVDLPGRVFVRGRGLDSEWGGALDVGGTVAAPKVVGEIASRRGRLDLLGRRFELERGTIAFVGRDPPIPDLDVRAGADGASIRAFVNVTGPADDFKLTLTSEPPYPQDEIVARLLFDREAASITPAQGLRLAAALRQLQSGGEGATGFARKTLGLDDLDVGGTGADDAAVSAGKYISDKVYLELQQGLTPETGKARVRIELTPNLSATTEVNQRAQTGVQLQWKHDY